MTKLEKAKETIINCLKNNDSMTTSEIGQQIAGVSLRTVQRGLVSLENESKVIRNKSTKTNKTFWALTVPATPKKNKTGVISTIITVLSGNEYKTKSQILAVLEKTFPERKTEAMKKTINVQIPYRLSKDKNLVIEKACRIEDKKTMYKISRESEMIKLTEKETLE